MQFRPFTPGIEVYGSAIELMLSGFKIFPSIATGYLAKYGLATSGPNGKSTFDPNRWHPQEAWLKMFEAIVSEVGATSLFEVGRQVGAANLMGVPSRDLLSKMQSIDIAYHLAHRRAGRVMFDRTSGEMLEGIGHYDCRVFLGEKSIVSICETPYPCEFDLGLITACTAELEPRAKTVHDHGAPCRKSGGDSCTYVTKW